MYRVIKALNNNGLLVLDMETSREVIFLGNGVGFGKKPGMRLASLDGAAAYQAEPRNTGDTALQAVNGLAPVFLEAAGRIIEEAARRFGNVNRNILLALADHIALAVERAKDKKEFSNPFSQDIQALFPEEFETARQGRQIIEQLCGQTLSEDETGFITLHIHAALSGEKVEESMKLARLVTESISMIETGLDIRLPVHSLGYSRLVSHIRYMLMRNLRNERVTLDMEDYARQNFPEDYALAQEIIQKLEQQLKNPFSKEETGFLAIHIKRASQLAEDETKPR